VLLLSELFPPVVGGSAVLLQGIYSRLDADVSVLTHGAPSDTFEHQGGLRVFRMPLETRSWGVRDLGALGQYWRVATRIRRLLPHRDGIVHCARALPEGLSAWMARMTGGPHYVCWAHGEDLTTALTSREFTALTALVFRGAAAALANSRNTATLLNQLGVPDEKIHVIHPAVDADRFHPKVDGQKVRQRYAERDHILLLSVGRLQRRKGQDVAIQAVAALKHELPSLRYVIAGDGEERERLTKLVADCGVQDRVFFAGIVPDDELSAYYAACDIFLLPNRVEEGDIEGFGIVFLEAAATGKPTIGGDSGGVPEAVERDVTGLLVDGSVEQVVGAIRSLATSEERRRRFGLAGRVRADGCFSWQRAASAVSALQARISGR
jgi:phosphatidylinositol alpha-1,6-mannosyltransferase